MKKLVSAAAIAALVAGAASAEVKANLASESCAVLGEWELGDAASRAKYSSVDGSNNAFGKDTFGRLKLSASGDNAGMKLNVESNVTTQAFKVGDYEAWAGAGNFKFYIRNTAGRPQNRINADENNLSILESNYGTKGYYSVLNVSNTGKETWAWSDVDKERANTDSAAKNALGEYRGVYADKGVITLPFTGKLGINTNAISSISSGNISMVGADVDNISTGKINTGIEYTLKDALPGTLTAKAYMNKNDKAAVTKDDDSNVTCTVNSGYSFQLDYNQSDLIQVTLDAHAYKQKQAAFAAFIAPKMVENLDAVVGFTYAYDKSTVAKKDATYKLDKTGTAVLATRATPAEKHDFKAWAIDARARYAFSDALAATLHANVTNYDLDTDSRDIDALTALSLIANVTYKVNDTFVPFAEIGYATSSLSSSDDNGYGAAYGAASMAANLGTKIVLSKNITMTTAAHATFCGLGMDKEKAGKTMGTSICVPLYFNFAL